MSKIHIMLDFETLGTKANTAVLSLGAVIFTATGPISSIYLVPSLKHQMRNRSITADTLAWWMDQGEGAKAVFKESSKSELTLAKFSSDFSVWVDKNVPNKRDLIAWSNGAGFDVPIMEHILDSHGLNPPWLFWNIRCYRTLKTLFPIEQGIEKPAIKHNALEDAKFQTRAVMGFLQGHPEMDK